MYNANLFHIPENYIVTNRNSKTIFSVALLLSPYSMVLYSVANSFLRLPLQTDNILPCLRLFCCCCRQKCNNYIYQSCNNLHGRRYFLAATWIKGGVIKYYFL